MFLRKHNTNTHVQRAALAVLQTSVFIQLAHSASHENSPFPAFCLSVPGDKDRLFSNEM